jgi:hypothetical protein
MSEPRTAETPGVIILMGSLAGAFYGFGLATGGNIGTPYAVSSGVAILAASLILFATVFFLDPDKPLLDDGAPEVDDGSRWYMGSHEWPHPDINAPVAADKQTAADE